MINSLWSLFSSRKKIQFQTIAEDLHSINKNQIDRSAMAVIKKLHAKGFQAFIVGGAVRDLILGFLPKDFDIVTNATPPEVKSCFSRAYIIGRRFRIVHVYLHHKIVEVSTFRSQDKPKRKKTDNRRLVLSDNKFGSHQDDAKRRDFTVNALYYNPIENIVYDAHNGIDDILQKKLTVIGNVDERFQEDPVRILRTLRFIAKLDFSINQNTTKAIVKQQHLLVNIPIARLADEFRKFLTCGYAYQGIHILAKWKLLDRFLIPIPSNDNNESIKTMINKVLINADQKYKNGQPTSLTFMVSIMLWSNLIDQYNQLAQLKVNNIVRFNLAIKEIIKHQQSKIFLTRQNCNEVKEIWLYQQNLLYPRPKNINRILYHRFFKKGVDFLLLRSGKSATSKQNLTSNLPTNDKHLTQSDFLSEQPNECLYWANWWQNYLNANQEQKQLLKSQWEKIRAANLQQKRRKHYLIDQKPRKVLK